MIPEPQRTYVLELWSELGPASADFVLVGGQALKFAVPAARATKDFDFVLDVIAIRQSPGSVSAALKRLGYGVVPESQNFQFEKVIPGSPHTMRVELLGPEEYRRRNDFRVDLGGNVHARACSGATIVLSESDRYEIEGCLPSGVPSSALIRVSRPHALVFMKCLAMDDRYRNIRGIRHYEHDRDSARTHVADIVDILTVQGDLAGFRESFINQFDRDVNLRARIAQITRDYFSDHGSPGMQLYQEHLIEHSDFDLEPATAERIRAQITQHPGLRMILGSLETRPGSTGNRANLRERRSTGSHHITVSGPYRTRCDGIDGNAGIVNAAASATYHTFDLARPQLTGRPAAVSRSDSR